MTAEQRIRAAAVDRLVCYIQHTPGCPYLRIPYWPWQEYQECKCGVYAAVDEAKGRKPTPAPSAPPQQLDAPYAATRLAHTPAGSRPQDAPRPETPAAGKQQKATSDR